MSSVEDPSELAETLERLKRIYAALSLAQESQREVDLSVELKYELWHVARALHWAERRFFPF